MKMSRSKKRTPVCGMSGARSEKRDKRLYNRRYRHRCRQALLADPGLELLPHRRECGNRAAMAKDGKAWVDVEVYPRAVRK